MKISSRSFRLVSSSLLAAATVIAALGASAGSASAAKPRPTRPVPTPLNTAAPVPTPAPFNAPTRPVLRLGAVTATTFTVVWDGSVDSVTGINRGVYNYFPKINGVTVPATNCFYGLCSDTQITFPLPPPGQTARVTIVAVVQDSIPVHPSSPPSAELVFTTPGPASPVPPPVLVGFIPPGSVRASVAARDPGGNPSNPQLYSFRFFVNGVLQLPLRGINDNGLDFTLTPGGVIRVTAQAVDPLYTGLTSPLSAELVLTAR